MACFATEAQLGTIRPSVAELENPPPAVHPSLPQVSPPPAQQEGHWEVSYRWIPASSSTTEVQRPADPVGTTEIAEAEVKKEEKEEKEEEFPIWEDEKRDLGRLAS